MGSEMCIRDRFSITGADSADFEIIGTELFLRAGLDIDFETQQSYNINIEVDDPAVGVSPDRTVPYSLSVNDINEAPTLTINPLNSGEIAENTSTASAIKVADIVINDDALGVNTLSISGGTDASRFTLIGTELFLNAGTVLNFESGKIAFNVDISVNDTLISPSPNDTESFQLNVTNVFETLFDNGNNIVDLNSIDITEFDSTNYSLGLGGNDHVTLPRTLALYNSAYPILLTNGFEAGAGNDFVTAEFSDANTTNIFSAAPITDGLDTYKGGAGRDIVSYEDTRSAKVVEIGFDIITITFNGMSVNIPINYHYITYSAGFSRSIEEDKLFDIDVILGSNNNDTFLGLATQKNEFHGLGGNDRFFTQRIDDIYRGGDGIDTLVLSSINDLNYVSSQTGANAVSYTHLTLPTIYSV